MKVTPQLVNGPPDTPDAVETSTSPPAAPDPFDLDFLRFDPSLTEGIGVPEVFLISVSTWKRSSGGCAVSFGFGNRNRMLLSEQTASADGTFAPCSKKTSNADAPSGNVIEELAPGVVVE